MENSQKSGPTPTETPFGRYAAIAAARPRLAFFYAFTALVVYFVLFLATGWLVSTLFSQPFWPCVGLVFLLRMCFT